MDLRKDKSDSKDEHEGIRKADGDLSQQEATALDAVSRASITSAATPVSSGLLLPNGGLPVALPGILGISIPGATAVAAGNGLPVDSACALNLQQKLAKIHADAMPEHYVAELEINDFPENARWKATHKTLWILFLNGQELPLPLEDSMFHLASSCDHFIKIYPWNLQALDYLGRSRGIQKTRELARKHASIASVAIDSLPESSDEEVQRSRRALVELTHRVITRTK
ncbi:hypothetical protein FXO38_27714 [Capsicum annuum]|nr:hypothetical protein FXO38_27714 [Capsicum annuum]KAF3629758.1 hypothetical protein FXO37_28781 [Capsicum annuum]